jgi:exodeoxyribonuclease VII small subunit
MTDDDLDSLTYEQLLEALEGLTAQMADGTVGIERATELYERANALHERAAARLRAVEERISRLAPPEP